MDLDDYACIDEKDENSTNQANNRSVDNNNRMRETLNRAPSAAVDPEFHRKAKQLKQKLNFTSRLLWITLAICVLTLILLVIQWIKQNSMRRGTQ